MPTEQSFSTLRAGRARAFAKELLTGIGGPNATTERLRLAGWVRLAFMLPFIWLPTLVSLYSIEEKGRHPDASEILLQIWTAHLVLWFCANGVLMFSRGRRPRLERLLTYTCVFLELSSNHLVMHLTGTLSSVAVVNLLAISVGYRVFLDFRMGVFAVIAGSSLFSITGALEMTGVVPIATGLPGEATVAAYLTQTTGWSTIIATTTSVLVVFAMVNYGVNQALKLHRYITESVLRRYLPAPLVARASRGELTLDAPPERRVVTVMFTDLVGFTSLSERMGPEAMGTLLNEYLSKMCSIAHRHEATIDKFIGDCIMIVFGAPEPLPEEEQARRCVLLAMELQSSVPRVDGCLLQARTGINTGEAVVGNFGSLVRSDYTVLGHTVNVAARLESASKPGRILVGEETARLLGGSIALASAGTLPLKGVSLPVEAWWVDEVSELKGSACDSVAS